MASCVSQTVVLALAPSPAFAATVDLSALDPITVEWVFSIQEMLQHLIVSNPASMVIVGDGDNIASLRACYALRQASTLPLHLISSTLSESEANLARSLGVSAVHTPEPASTAIARSVGQFLKISGNPGRNHREKVIMIKGMEIDLGRRTVCLSGQSIPVTRTEFELLVTLVEATGSVVPRGDLVTRVWGANWYGAENVLDTHLAHLRRKMAVGGFDRVIVNVRGVGFYFEPRNVCRQTMTGLNR